MPQQSEENEIKHDVKFEGTVVISQAEWNDRDFEIILNRKLEGLGEMIRRQKYGER